MFVSEFDRFAQGYLKNREIQTEVAEKLLKMLPARHYRSVLDMGCGDGAVFKSGIIESDMFTACDLSPRMCALHPITNGVYVINGDFDDPTTITEITAHSSKYDLLVSSSALQWSKSLELFFERYSKISSTFAVSIFTDKTFDSVNKFLEIKSFLPSTLQLKNILSKYKISEFKSEIFTKSFESGADAVRFIKQTGVSGKRNEIGYKEGKRLHESGPNVLEFEVFYAVGSFSKNDFSTS